MFSSRSVLIVVLLVVAGLDLRPAHAESSNAHSRASASFEQARAAFARREYTAAAVAFEQAGEYEPHPVAWLDAAEAWIAADDPVKAATNCQRALDDRAAARTYREQAEKCLQSLQRRVATLDLRGGGQATSGSIDDGPAVVLPGRRFVTPGKHVVTLNGGTGTAGRFEIDAVAGQVTRVEPVSLAPTTHAVDPAVRETSGAHATVTSRSTFSGIDPLETKAAPSSGPPVASWFAFGVAGVAVLATGVFGIRALNAQSDFDAVPSAATRDGFYREQRLTNISVGVAVIAAGTGFLIWALSPKRSARPTARAFPKSPAETQ